MPDKSDVRRHKTDGQERIDTDRGKAGGGKAMQCSFAKQNTGHGTNAAKKVAAAPADTYRRNGKPPLQIIVLKTQLLARSDGLFCAK